MFILIGKNKKILMMMMICMMKPQRRDNKVGWFSTAVSMQPLALHYGDMPFALDRHVVFQRMPQ
jgi:hypothetical protein